MNRMVRNKSHILDDHACYMPFKTVYYSFMNYEWIVIKGFGLLFWLFSDSYLIYSIKL
jgi:hypothetical protein